MKKIYRKLFEFFAWLGWVTGWEWFTGMAIRFYFKSSYIVNVNGSTIISNVELSEVPGLSELLEK